MISFEQASQSFVAHRVKQATNRAQRLIACLAQWWQKDLAVVVLQRERDGESITTYFSLSLMRPLFARGENAWTNSGTNEQREVMSVTLI